MVNAPKAQWEPLRCLRIFGFTPTMTGTLRRSPSPSHRGFALPPLLPPSLRSGGGGSARKHHRGAASGTLGKGRGWKIDHGNLEAPANPVGVGGESGGARTRNGW